MAANREQVSEAYRLYGPVIYRRCLALLGAREDASEATREIFVRLMGEAGPLEDRKAVLSWIHRTAGSHCLGVLGDGRRAAVPLARPLESGPEGGHALDRLLGNARRFIAGSGT